MRRLRLAEPLSSEGVLIVQDIIGRLMGVIAVEAHGKTIVMAYDLLQVGLEDLERALRQAGIRLGTAWPEPFQRAIIHEFEEQELDADEVTPPTL